MKHCQIYKGQAHLHTIYSVFVDNKVWVEFFDCSLTYVTDTLHELGFYID